MSILQKTIHAFDAQAEKADDRAGFWQMASLLLTIWSCGGVPAAGYGPQAWPDLFNAHKRLGRDFRIAVDARAFTI